MSRWSTALAHVIVTEGLVNEQFVRERCDWDEFQDWAEFVADTRHSPEEVEKLYRRSRRCHSRRRAALCHRRQRRHLLRARRYRAQPGLDHGDGDRQSRHGHRQYRPRGRRRESACAVRTTSRAPATWAPSRTKLSGYRHVSDDATRAMFEALWGRPLDAEPGLRIPNMIDAAVDGSLQGTLHPGRGHPPVGSRHQAYRRRALPRWNAWWCRICS